MNNKLVPVLAVILLVASGGYYWTKLRPTVPVTPQTTSQAVNEATEFARAIESGKPTTCVMTKDNDKMEYFTHRSHSHNCGEGGRTKIRE